MPMALYSIAIGGQGEVTFMKKWVKRIMIPVILLIVGLGVFFVYRMVTAVEDTSYAAMDEATLPVVQLYYAEGMYNELHGYLQEMDAGTMRDAITPLSEKRTLDLYVQTYARQIDAVSYQVRSLDGSHLYEESQVADMQQDGGRLYASIQLASLLEENTEYSFIVNVSSNGQVIRYYSRVIFGTEMYTEQLIGFVKDFSDATFLEEDTDKVIINNLQSDGTMPTDNYGYVNIHSKYTMIAWGDLTPNRISAVRYRITDLSSTQMSLTMYYTIEVVHEEERKEYSVEEYFCVRSRNDRIYLLDYERYMKEKFVLSEERIKNGAVSLGITSADCSLMTSPDKKTKAFIYDNQLWSCRVSKETEFREIFSFRDESDPSTRSANSRHHIELVRVLDSGDMDFIVYGYMNRGIHEGGVGISYYRYAASADTLDELFFIPVNVGNMVLQADMGALNYVSETDLFYCLYGRQIYSIDLTSGETTLITDDVYPGSFAVSDDGSIIAWQEGEQSNLPHRILVLNMKSGMQKAIEAKTRDYVLVKGFIGNDLVYGTGHIEDLQVEAGVTVRYPLYALEIIDVDADLSVQNHYEVANVYIADAEINDNNIVLERIQKNSEGGYMSVDSDMILLNVSEDVSKNGVLRFANSKFFLREYRIDLGLNSSLKLVISENQPRYDISSVTHRINLERGEDFKEVYYVYGGGKLHSIKGNLAEAIREAYDVMGAVISTSQTYLWSRSSRPLYKTLSFENESTQSEAGTLEAALRIMLKLEGASYEGIQTELIAGKSPLTILDSRMNNRGVNLYGITVQQALYYVALGHPVLAVTGNDTGLLIIGYETTKITVYDPNGGATLEMTMEEAEEYFAGYGYNFVSYVE